MLTLDVKSNSDLSIGFYHYFYFDIIILVWFFFLTQKQHFYAFASRGRADWPWPKSSWPSVGDSAGRPRGRGPSRGVRSAPPAQPGSSGCGTVGPWPAFPIKHRKTLKYYSLFYIGVMYILLITLAQVPRDTVIILSHSLWSNVWLFEFQWKWTESIKA